MNKIGIVLGAAALAVVAGCKDPNYIPPAERAQNKAKSVRTTPAPAPVLTPDVKPAPVEPVAVTTIEVVETPATPVEIAQLPGAPEVKPAPAPVETPAPEAATTPYIVQRGDYLAKISKKYNVKLDALRKANPQLKNDVVRLGQTIQIPGKVDVGEQTVPEGAVVKPAPKAKVEYKPYTGETKEYVVKSGDYLGKIAAASKISVRQLKELNGLTSDVVRVGQKLKVPASAPVTVAATAPAPKAEAKKPVVVAETPKAPTVVAAPVPVDDLPGVVETPVVEAATVVEEPAPAPDATGDDSVRYVVQEGEDIISLSISFGVDPAVIREMNNMGEQDQVKPGQVIKLPPEAN